MADLPLSLSGKTEEGIEWSVEVKESGADSFRAVVKVGSTVKAIGKFVNPVSAKNAGCQLVADTLAELTDA